VAIDETDPANVLVTAHTTPEQRGVQAVVQLDWEDAPTGVTTDADGVATFPPYSLPYATTFSVTVGGASCTASTTTIPTAPPPSCELFVDTSNAPADVVTVETFPHLPGAPVVLDDGTTQLNGTTGAGGSATFNASFTPPVTITATVNGAAQCTTDL
jgi:hypothetical protein